MYKSHAAGVVIPITTETLRDTSDEPSRRTVWCCRRKWVGLLSQLYQVSNVAGGGFVGSVYVQHIAA